MMCTRPLCVFNDVGLHIDARHHCLTLTGRRCWSGGWMMSARTNQAVLDAEERVAGPRAGFNTPELPSRRCRVPGFERHAWIQGPSPKSTPRRVSY